MTAHVGGVPLEEMLPALVGTGAGTGLLIVRAKLAMLRRRKGHDR